MDYVTPMELAALLASLWLPVFALAAFVQWRLLASAPKPALWLLAALPAEALIAFAIWLSPLNRLLPSLRSLGPLFEMGSLPLQAAILSAIVATALIWVGGGRGRRSAP
jgi:hypothetical protein